MQTLDTKLDEAMHHWRTAQETANGAREELVSAMREAHEQGMSYREIARATGVSFQRIGQLIKEYD